jgi:hypothetical protein
MIFRKGNSNQLFLDSIHYFQLEIKLTLIKVQMPPILINGGNRCNF